MIWNSPNPVTVTTWILPFLVWNPYKTAFVTVAGCMFFHGSIGCIEIHQLFPCDARLPPKHRDLRSQDAAFIVTAGNDKQIRIWKRTQAGFFASMSDGCPIGSNGSMVSFNGLFHLLRNGIYIRIPKNPDTSRKIVGLMVETSHPQK